MSQRRAVGPKVVFGNNTHTFLREITLPGFIRQVKKKQLDQVLLYISKDVDGWLADLQDLLEKEPHHYFDRPNHVSQGSLHIEIVRKKRPAPCPHRMTVAKLTLNELEIHYFDYYIRFWGENES